MADGSTLGHGAMSDDATQQEAARQWLAMMLCTVFRNLKFWPPGAAAGLNTNMGKER
jgi:hypothetical protein